MSEPTTAKCPTCDSELLFKDGQTFCPSCLLQQGMQTSAFAGNVGFQGWSPPDSETLAERFPNLEILELIGQGGMGAVFRVRQVELDRPAALKVLPDVVGTDPAFTERFLREARLLASLSHPHIVTVYEFGQRDGLYFILMEFVDGVTLRQASLADPIKRLSSKEALAVVGQLCEALQFAHDEGVVHRDIKPENILIDRRGRVKIADFGLAKLLGKPADLPTLTKTHQLMGTPAYMSPEQIEGQSVIDHRADIYSLGVVFYELLTGELPLGRFQPPSEKADLDARLDEVVLRTLEKEPERRYQHASQVRTDMNAIQHASNENGPVTGRLPVWAQLLIVGWAAVCTWVAMQYWSANMGQRIATTVGVSVLVLLLATLVSTGAGKWRYARLATALLVGILLPGIALHGGFQSIKHGFKDLGDRSANRINALTAESKLLSRNVDTLSNQISQMGGIPFQPSPVSDAMYGDGDFGGSGEYEGEEAEDDYSSGAMGMGMGMGFGEQMSGVGMGGGSLGMDSVSFGEDYEGSGGMNIGFAPGLDRTADNSFGFSGGPLFNAASAKAIDRILKEAHQKYVDLETAHWQVRASKDGSVHTSILPFPDEWSALENEIWTNLDDSANIHQQRWLRNNLKLANESDSSVSAGMGGTDRSKGTLTPGILGWSQSDLKSTGPVAVVTIGRNGRWYRWHIAAHNFVHSYPSAPSIPPEIARFESANGPHVAISNARSALARESFPEFASCFTLRGRLDWSMGILLSLGFDPATSDVDAEVFRKLMQTSEVSFLKQNARSQSTQEIESPFLHANDAAILEKLIEERTKEIIAYISDSDSTNDRMTIRNALAEHKSSFASIQDLVTAVALCRIYQPDSLLPFQSKEKMEFQVANASNVATGTFEINDASLQIGFVKEENEWKIDAVLSPQTSFLKAQIPNGSSSDEQGAPESIEKLDSKTQND